MGQERALSLEPGLQPSGFVPCVGYLSLCPCPQRLCGVAEPRAPALEGGILGGQRAGEWGDLRTLNWEVSGAVWSRAAFSHFRILPRAGQEAGRPLQSSAWSFRIQMTPVGVPPPRVQRRAVWLLHPLEHLSTLAGGWWEADTDSSPPRKGKMLCVVS